MMKAEYFPLEEITDRIIGAGIEIHKHLGCGFLEIVYKDALENEFDNNDIPFCREQEYSIKYKGILLKHKFYADFVIMNKVILEVKAKSSMTEEDYPQTINYLKCSGNAVALILNFGSLKLGIKRLIF